eukprot:Em0009g86a
MAVHGAVGQFNEEAEEWPAYCERLMHYFTANDVETAEKRRAILLSVCGAHIYQLVRSLVSPEKPADKTFEEIVKLVRDHLHDTTNLRVSCDGFISTPVSKKRLRQWDSLSLSFAVSPSTLTFTKAFELAQAAELAEKSSQDISRAGASVNALGPKRATAGQTADNPTPCFRCGEPLEEEEDVEDMYTLFNVRDVSLAPFRVPMEINEASLEMEVDTGAAASVISEVTYKTLWKGKCNERPPLKHTNALLRTYTGERLRILGRIAVQVRYQKQEANLSLLVIGGDGPSLLGRDWIAPAEAKYSQIEKEGLAIVFGVTKFHQYLVGRSFTIYSDHKPLQYLFSETRPVPPMASSRIQRWALTLSAYNYRIMFKSGDSQANADAFSRLPLSESTAVVPVPGDTIFKLETLRTGDSPVTAAEIKSWTNKDPILSRVRNMALTGWQAIKILRNLFATHGLPEIVVSDNGSAFTSAEFQTFVKRNGIKHVRSAPYHPSSNGQAERVVQTFKEAILKTTGDLDARLARFLFQTFCIQTSHPRQERQKEAHDQHAKYRKFQNGDLVYARNFHGSPTWVPGVVTAMSGPVSMVIQLEDGQAVRRHTDHIKAQSTTPELQVPKKTTAVQQDEVVDLPDIQEEAATREEEGPPMVNIPVPSS